MRFRSGERAGDEASAPEKWLISVSCRVARSKLTKFPFWVISQLPLGGKVAAGAALDDPVGNEEHATTSVGIAAQTHRRETRTCRRGSLNSMFSLRDGAGDRPSD